MDAMFWCNERIIVTNQEAKFGVTNRFKRLNNQVYLGQL